MDSIKALEWRYATKKFNENKLLPTSKIEVLKKAFNLTATSYGLQPIKLVIVSNKKMQHKLMGYSWNQKQISSASHLLIICIEKKIDENFIKAYFERVKKLRQTPDEILKPFEEFLLKDFNERQKEEIEEWSLNQAYLALGTLLSICAMEEIDACPMEGFEPKNYDKLLKLDEHNLKSVLLLPVGYRAEDDFFSGLKKVRRPLGDTIIEID